MGAMVERASSVPLSASCMVNRAEMLALVERARAELPVELDQAAELLVAHQEVISRAETEAEELLAQAQADAEQMLTESALIASAHARSEQILDAARAEAARLLRECDLYCDNRLGALEDTLNRSLGQVRRGRDRLRDRSELDYLEPLPDGADPEGRDVQVEYQQAVERQHEQQEREAWVARERNRDEAYDQYEQDEQLEGEVLAPTEDAYDQEREAAQAVQAAHALQASRTEADGVVWEVARPGDPEPEPDAEATLEDPEADDVVDPRASSGQKKPDDYGRVPAGVGTGLATGPERRVLDLTAVERAAERSGLG
jgi:hypothetical protein